MGIAKYIHSLNTGARRIVSTCLVYSTPESQELDTSDLRADFHSTGNYETEELEGTADSFLW